MATSVARAPGLAECGRRSLRLGRDGGKPARAGIGRGDGALLRAAAADAASALALPRADVLERAGLSVLVERNADGKGRLGGISGGRAQHRSGVLRVSARLFYAVPDGADVAAA